MIREIREHRIQPSDRPKARYEYIVSGQTEFPIDMLRYDSAWPKTSGDSAKIDFILRARERRSICLVSYHKPTAERWLSFGWKIGE